MAKKKYRNDQALSSDEELLEQLKKIGRPVSTDLLLKILHLARGQKYTLEVMLRSLQEKKKVEFAHGLWHVMKKRTLIKGVLSVQRSGVGFILAEKEGKEDVFVSPVNMGGAWDGDTVEAVILPGRRGPKQEARITTILEQKKKAIPSYAISYEKFGVWTCVPAGNGIQSIFKVYSETIHKGDLLLLEPLKQSKPGIWDSKLIRNLENESLPATQEFLGKINHNIPMEFPSLVVKETQNFSSDPIEADWKGRKDLQDLFFVTIDGEDAKDFDDAIQVEKIEQGFLLRVAIADVAHYVLSGTAIDNEARLRGNSYYFPMSVEPMLPESLSNGLCSLRPNVPRLAMVAEMLFSSQGNELQSSFYPAVIKSKARLTYNQVRDAIIEKKEEERTPLESLLPMLDNALALAKILATVRKKRGVLDFGMPESHFNFTEKGLISGISPREQHFAHQLIEEFMIAANESVARFLKGKEEFLYRIHPAPNQDKIEALTNFLQRLGLATMQPQQKNKDNKKQLPKITIHDLSKLLEQVKDTPQEYTVNRLLLRSMMQAKYSLTNEGHFGLGSDFYCHFTSPIRRYADLVVHRSLKKTLSGIGDSYTPDELEAIANHINKTERLAMEAEREVQKRLTILFLSDKVGKEYEGIISGVTDFGIFVELSTLMAEGMVPVASLRDDYYDFFSEQQLLRGRSKGASFSIGQKVKVLLSDVVLQRLEINLSIIECENKIIKPALQPKKRITKTKLASKKHFYKKQRKPKK